MELKLFNFIEEVIEDLEQINDELEIEAREIEIYF